MNNFNVDFDKTVFIVDDATTAFIVAIIAGDNAIHCIVEAKSGCHDTSLLSVVELLLAEVKFKSKHTYNVPSPFFLVDKSKPYFTLKKLVAFRNELKKIPINKDNVYAGGTTSAILCRIKAERRKYYIEHGTGDYYHRTLARNGTKSLKSTILQFVFNVFGLAFHNYNNNSKGFTLCKIAEDTFAHVDYLNFHSNKVSEVMASLVETALLSPKNTLFLAESDWHTGSGIDGNTTLYNKLNIEMIEKNVGKDETIFLKFHPMVGLAGSIKMDLKEKLSAKGYRVYNVTDFFEDKIGYYVPAEIIVKYCNISKIVCSESSVFWNVTHNFDGKLISEAKLLEKYFPDKIKSKYVEFMNKYVEHKILL